MCVICAPDVHYLNVRPHPPLCCSTAHHVFLLSSNPPCFPFLLLFSSSPSRLPFLSPIFQMAILTLGLFHCFSGTRMRPHLPKRKYLPSSLCLSFLPFQSCSLCPPFHSSYCRFPLLSCSTFLLPPELQPIGRR